MSTPGIISQQLSYLRPMSSLQTIVLLPTNVSPPTNVPLPTNVPPPINVLPVTKCPTFKENIQGTGSQHCIGLLIHLPSFQREGVSRNRNSAALSPFGSLPYIRV